MFPSQNASDSLHASVLQETRRRQPTGGFVDSCCCQDGCVKMSAGGGRGPGPRLWGPRLSPLIAMTHT